MWNFQRIICIWICCVSCMFGTTQLSSLVQAVPYEYFDEHEQSFYDLDTEQIQAKYDARLLTQQMLQTEQQQQQLQQHLAKLKGFHQTSHTEIGASGNRNKLDIRKPNDEGFAYASQSQSQSTSTLTKLKNNDGHTSSVDAEADERNDWLEEMVTMATDSTSAVTDPLDELHLPRAASCFTNGQKYTHGQKVPRLDNCEVCLCMDGEIFCWWEKCDKKSTKASTTYDDYSTPFEESSTTRIQLNPKTTYKTTLKPMKKPKIKTEKDYKYDDDDSAEIRDVQHEQQQEFGGIKEQLRRKEQQQQEQEQHKIHHNKQMVKKKIYQQQEEEKHNKKIKELNKKKQEEQLKQQRHKQQQQQHKSKEHFEQQQQQQQHHHVHNHNSNSNNNHDYGSSGSNSKILNFPENLPSVLYYDYKTEEHHQHQHQHREQHLKHQKQKQQQQQQQLLLQQHEHEKEIKQQQQLQQQQHHVNHHHEYGQDFNIYNSLSNNRPAGGVQADADSAVAGEKTKLHNGFVGPSTTFKYFNNGNEKIYNSDLLTDSDILPEPPTKKPKFSTSITDITETAKTTGIPMTQFYRTSSTTSTAGAVRKQTTASLTNTPPTASIPLKKIIFSPWERDKAKNNNNSNNKDKDNNEHDISNNNSNNDSNNKNNNESAEDIIDTDDDQDDAFHRWLTSTETNNKNNFTLSNSNTAMDVVDGGHAAAAASASSGTGNSDLVDASKSDYNVEDRNYENFDWEAEMGFVRATLKPAEAKIKMLTTTTNTLNIALGGGEGGGAATIYDDIEPNGMPANSAKLNYEQEFTNNNMKNGNGIINIKSNSNNNISPFGNSNYQNYNQNNYMERQPATSSSSSSVGNDISSTNSNEDNNVASVVNIDIMLTASSADSQVQQQQQQQQPNLVAFDQHIRQLQDFEHDKGTTKTQLTSNTNAFDNSKPLYSIINDNTNHNNNNNSNTIYNKTISNIAEQRLQLKDNMGVDLSSRTNINTSSTSPSLSNSKNNFSFNQISTLVSEANSTSIPPTGAAAAATTEGTSAVATPSLITTPSPERQCNVMGTLYKIGDVLPQDTGNCLQCICIDGSTSDDTPRVTCSPHNCPPLVLPDLFDATGY